MIGKRFEILQHHSQNLQRHANSPETTKRGRKVANKAAADVNGWKVQVERGALSPGEVTLLLMKQYWRKQHIVGKLALGVMMAEIGHRFGQSEGMDTEALEEFWQAAQAEERHRLRHAHNV